MKNIITILIFALALGLGEQQIHAKAAPEKAVAVSTVTPKMSCQNCENKIKSNLRFEKGVSEIVTDLRSQTVTIKYNAAKTGIEALKKAFSKIGYTAVEATGDSPAACPADSAAAPCCR
ncbi:MAG: heavy-metal-associated domain-containing protein [Muribaculaceae bacterium]|nr:heavy-metal-associated domain-containing protein [Muribaculaceae bacterium]